MSLDDKTTTDRGGHRDRRTFWIGWWVGLASFIGGIALVGLIPGEQVALSKLLACGWAAATCIGIYLASTSIWRSPLVYWGILVMVTGTAARVELSDTSVWLFAVAQLLFPLALIAWFALKRFAWGGTRDEGARTLASLLGAGAVGLTTVGVTVVAMAFTQSPDREEPTPAVNREAFLAAASPFSDGLDEEGLGQEVCRQLRTGASPMKIAFDLMDMKDVMGVEIFGPEGSAVFLAAATKYLCPEQRQRVLEVADEMGWPESTKNLFSY